MGKLMGMGFSVTENLKTCFRHDGWPDFGCPVDASASLHVCGAFTRGLPCCSDVPL